MNNGNNKKVGCPVRYLNKLKTAAREILPLSGIEVPIVFYGTVAAILRLVDSLKISMDIFPL